MYVVIKKILLVFALISISLFSYSTEKLEVQLVLVSNIYFNHNCCQWTQNVINQKTLLNNKSIHFKLPGTNTLFAEINFRKNDKKYQYYGDYFLLIDLNEIDLSKDYSFAGEVIAVKDREYYTNCIFKCTESVFKYLQWLMPIHYQRALDIKRILISNRYYNLPAGRKQEYKM